jgi:large subunit ribosomal protein L9
MKVILLQDVENLGKKYDVKEVKNGYARNSLLPQNLIKLATKDNMKWLKAQKEVIEKVAGEDLKMAQELASKLDDVEVSMVVKASEGKHLFEAINASKISEKLKELGYEVKKSQIKLDKPIKELGEFPVKINLDHNLEIEIKLILTEEAGEVESEIYINRSNGKIYLYRRRSDVGNWQRNSHRINWENLKE